MNDLNNQKRIVFTRGGFATDLSRRIPEEDEVISGIEGEKYANRKDDRSLTFKMVAFDIVERSQLTKDSKVLEVCCAAGQLAHELAKYVNPENILATDGGTELINAAQVRYGSEGIKFEVQDVHDMKATTGFDCVVCKDSFHHFHDPVKTIKELVGQLRKGGTLYIFDLCRAANDTQVKTRETAIESDHEAMRFLRSLNASFTPEEFSEITKSAGVEKLEIVYPLKYSDKNEQFHQQEIKNDAVKEFKLETLSAVYLLKK